MNDILFLLRHAKTEIGFNDHDIKLTEKGIKEAEKISQYILKKTN